MKYSSMLRKHFKGTSLQAKDLLLLETFQISYLPDRVPQKEFAALIRSFPCLKDFLLLKDPSIEGFIESMLDVHEEIFSKEQIEEDCQEALWEIADLIVYNKHPEIYDEKVGFHWDLEEIVDPQSLNGKVVADVGAGTGRLAFLLADYAETVFAVEPISSFRSFMKQKAAERKTGNLFVMDGLLESIPLPENSLDMLFTSNAIGWNLENELHEMERVLRPKGLACHIMRMESAEYDNPVHKRLVSADWNYAFSEVPFENGIKAKYVKTIR